MRQRRPDEEIAEMSDTSTSGRWTAAGIPDQHGRTAVVTGANTGLGFETARLLAGHGATVVLACRDLGKAEEAAARLRASVPDARLRVIRLDLGSLASVRAAAAELRESYPRLDLLINNAGVMMPPYGRTEDGFELQFGTNHLGHFALTGLVLDTLLAAPGSRIVTVSSNGHRPGNIYFGDINFERKYRRIRAYGQSKLANLMFTYELQRRLAAAGAATSTLAAHPGSSMTELQRYTPAWTRAVGQIVPSNPPERGALPTLRAATDPSARGGQYYGPGGWGQWTGYPVLVESSARSHDSGVQRRLWELSERLTGVTYHITETTGQRTT
jgi:NAD(P)-dependent dehydrogenase (short-subunit alcohol dehydrogenase family)